MLAPERHELILRSLRRDGRLRVAELAAELGVSAITVRRDLAELDSAGLLRRVHGGAVATRSAGADRQDSGLTLGIVVPSAATYYSDVIRGAEAAAGQYGARLVLGVSSYDPAMEPDRVERVLAAGRPAHRDQPAQVPTRRGRLSPPGPQAHRPHPDPPPQPPAHPPGPRLLRLPAFDQITRSDRF